MTGLQVTYPFMFRTDEIGRNIKATVKTDIPPGGQEIILMRMQDREANFGVKSHTVLPRDEN